MKNRAECFDDNYFTEAQRYYRAIEYLCECLVLLSGLIQESVGMYCNLLKKPGFFGVSLLIVYSHSTSFISELDN